MTSVLVHGGTVLTMNEDDDVVADGAVLIEDDRIAYVGDQDGLDESESPDQIIDATGKVIMPGLVNAHSHLNMTYGRTIGYDNDLLGWLETQIPLLNTYTPEDWRLAETVGCIENIKSGCTVVNEVNFAQHGEYDVNIDHLCIEACQETGIRTILSRGYADGEFFPGYAEDTDEIIEKMTELIEEYHEPEDGRVSIQLAPLVPWACSPDLFRQTRELADTYDVGIHLHTAETPQYNELVDEIWGYDTNIEYLDATGVLGPDVQLNHAIWLNESDIDLIRETDSQVIHNPTSNMVLASGVADVPEMMEMGITVGLACDGPACNNNQDLVTTMKDASLLHKVESLEADKLTAADVLRMATIDGARALGLGDLIGSLEEGKKGDVITLDLTHANTTPSLDVAGAIVYSAAASNVTDVIVDGDVVMEDRTMLAVDEDAVLAEAQQAAQAAEQRADI